MSKQTVRKKSTTSAKSKTEVKKSAPQPVSSMVTPKSQVVIQPTSPSSASAPVTHQPPTSPAPIQSQSNPVEPIEGQPTIDLTANEPQAEIVDQPAQKPGKSHAWIWALLLLVVLAGIGVVTWWYLYV